MQINNIKGFSNVQDDKRLPDSFFREIVDFNPQKYGGLKQRRGYTSKDNGVYSSIGGDNNRCFALRNGDLVEVVESNGNYIFETLLSRFGDTSFDIAECGSDYYIVSNNVNCIISQNSIKAFGLPQVARQPSISEVSFGDLLAGDYLVAVTFLDANGLESGTVSPAKYTVTENGKGLVLSDFYTTRNTNVEYMAIYVSTKDGEELYRQGIINVGASVISILSVSPDTEPLNSIGMYPSPNGKLIAYNYGVLYIACDNILYYCSRKVYTWWSPLWSYEYDGIITAIMPCESGMWVGTNKGLYWIGGRTPAYGIDDTGDFSQVKKHSANIMQGSARKIAPEFINQLAHGWFCCSKNEVFMLLDGGQFQNITQEQIKFTDFDSVSSAIVQSDNDDCIRYLAIMHGANVPSRSF